MECERYTTCNENKEKRDVGSELKLRTQHHEMEGRE